MKLKNKAEREEFIKNYQEWELLYNLEEIKVKIYKKQLNTGAVIYATEYEGYNGYKKEFYKSVKYHLVLPSKDEYRKNSCCGYEFCVTYDPSGDSLSTLVDYLTKNREEIEVE